MDRSEDTERTAIPPLPVLTGRPLIVPEKEPSIVRDARILNMLAVGICALSTLAMGFMLLTGGQTFETTAAIFLLCFYAGLGLLSLWLIRGLRRRDPTAWGVQRIVSFLGLLAFPLGTLIHGLLLSRWFKPETKAWFGLS